MRSRTSQASGGKPVASLKRRWKVRVPMRARAATEATLAIRADMLAYPVHGRRDPVGIRVGQGAQHQLPLVAVAVRRHHQPLRHPVRHFRPVIAAHPMQQHVQAGGRAGRGDRAIVVDIQHARFDGDLRKSGTEALQVAPVGGGPAAVGTAMVAALASSSSPCGACTVRPPIARKGPGSAAQTAWLYQATPSSGRASANSWMAQPNSKVHKPS